VTSRQNPLVIASLVISVLALIAGVCGGAYAVAKINGKDIKKASIAGKKLKNDTVTGKQVKESSLQGLAPSGNFQRIRAAITTTESLDVDKQVLDLGSLEVVVRCDGTFPLATYLFARSKQGEMGWDQAGVLQDASGDPVAVANGGIFSSTLTQVAHPNTIDNWYREIGTVVFNNDTTKESITLDYAVFGSQPAPGSTFCNLAGTVTRTVG
jgi:hypothetical protein